MRRRTSRLTKIQEKKNKRQAVFFIFLTGLLFLVLIFLGIPLLIKMVVFLGDLRSSSRISEAEGEVILRAPQLLPLPEATKSAYLDIKGYAGPGTTIKVLRNNIEKEKTVVDKEGVFSISKFRLQEGENDIKAIAVDPTGQKESEESKTYSILFDQTPPELKITNPEDGEEFFDKDKEIAIEGKSEPEVKLTINGFLAMVDPEGYFSKMIELKEGENEIKVEVIDKAGNKTEKAFKIKYTP